MTSTSLAVTSLVLAAVCAATSITTYVTWHPDLTLYVPTGPVPTSRVVGVPLVLYGALAAGVFVFGAAGSLMFGVLVNSRDSLE